MAMGGSTNTVLHTLAIANEAGIDYDLERINEIAKRRLIYLRLRQVLHILCMMSTKQVVVTIINELMKKKEHYIQIDSQLLEKHFVKIMKVKKLRILMSFIH